MNLILNNSQKASGTERLVEILGTNSTLVGPFNVDNSRWIFPAGDFQPSVGFTWHESDVSYYLFLMDQTNKAKRKYLYCQNTQNSWTTDQEDFGNLLIVAKFEIRRHEFLILYANERSIYYCYTGILKYPLGEVYRNQG